MSDELQEAIYALQGDDEARAQRAFATIAEIAQRDPGESAVELSRAILAEHAAGALRTPRLLTLLGLTRVPVPECLPVCLDLLRALASTETQPPADAALGAAVIVARTQPRALLPDIASIQSDPQAAQVMDRQIAQAPIRLLSITSKFLRALPDNAVTEMARWLWCDCATLDLMTLADFVGLHLEKSGADDPIVALMIDLAERVPATADEKRYTGQRLQESGVNAAAIEQLRTVWRAIRVAPALDSATIGQPSVLDPEPPQPEPRVDEWLAAFDEGDDAGIELARAALDEMFEEVHPPAALTWWTAVTVDALPLWRRRADIDWALVRFGNTLRKRREQIPTVPPSLLRQWLDTPQLLDPNGTRIALDLLSRQQPSLVAQRFLHRAVAATGERHPKILMGGMWRALAAAEPSAVLRVASRWIAFGFGRSAFLDLLLEVLIERARDEPALIDTLANALTPDMPVDLINIARELLNELRNTPPEDLQP